jgi:hypothetical protein
MLESADGVLAQRDARATADAEPAPLRIAHGNPSPSSGESQRTRFSQRRVRGQPSNLNSCSHSDPFRRLVDQFGELRFGPGRQRRRFAAPASGERSRYVFRHDAPAWTRCCSS